MKEDLFRVEQRISKGQSVRLEAVALLAGLPENIPLFHTQRGLRHPMGLYNASVGLVAERLLRVTDIISRPSEVLEFLNAKNNVWADDLAERADALLDALMEHMDDCGNVLKCFVRCRLGGVPAFKKYKKDVAEYRNHIGRIVNYLKHGQGRIRVCVMYSGGSYIPGYYIEGVDHLGALGPHPEIHSDGVTAFSFMRDLRFHVVSMFRVSVELAMAVQAIAKCGDLSRKPYKNTADRMDALTQAIVTLADYPRQVFPDEVANPWPSISKEDGADGTTRIVIEYPSTSERPSRLPGPTYIVTNCRGDGVSRTFRLPYLNANKLGQI